jgi:glutamyl-tRNA synthetase
VIENKLSELSFALLAAYDNGELLNALEEGHSGWQKCARTLENQ